MAYAITLDELQGSGACSDRRDAAIARIQSWPATASDAGAAGMEASDILWAAFAVARQRGDAELHRRVSAAAADIADRVLPIYEKQHPGDMRVRNCITAARRFARGDTYIHRSELIVAMDAAMAASKEAEQAPVGEPTWVGAATRAAARDAAQAAAWCAVSSVAHKAAANAAHLAASAAAWDTGAAGNERTAQKRIIIHWLTGAISQPLEAA